MFFVALRRFMCFGTLLILSMLYVALRRWFCCYVGWFWGYWLWAAIGIPYISLMHPLVILCLSFGEVPMRFRWRWVANARQ